MQIRDSLDRATLLVAFCASLAASTAALADALTDRARRLLEQRQPREAYQLLLPQEAARAGEPEFDYLLGIAALDSGAPERAVFALERVLAVQPENHVARAEIARAYLAMGERDAARREFEAVRSQPIPAEAKATVERFLSAIAAADVTQISGYIELGAGHDSNVNSATTSSQIALPALGGAIVALDPNSTRTSDAFASLSGGVGVTHKLSPDWAVVGAASGSVKLNQDATQFDTVVFDASLGVRRTLRKEAFTLGAQYQDFELDYRRFRQIAGVVAQWQHSYDERRQATLYGQFSDLHYPGQDIRDARRGVLGVAYAQAFSGDRAPVLFASVYGGEEREEAADVPHLGHQLWGVRLGGQLRLSTGWAAFGNIAFEHRKYGGPDPLFGETRVDRQGDGSLGLSYVIRPGATLIAQVSSTRNDSNIELNDFTRTLGTVSVRFNF